MFRPEQGYPLRGWQIRREGESHWLPIAVPGCWEDAGFPADDPGPYWYRAELATPPLADNQRLWLYFGAVSYHTTVFVDGQQVGEHTGMWDAFEVEVPPSTTRRDGRPAELLVCVEKPASLTAGPDSPTVPGRFPLRQTLSGFLPYVWGHAFGGLWQQVRWAITGPRRLGAVQARGEADGRLRLWGECSAPGPVAVTIYDPAGRPVVEETMEAGLAFDWSGRLPAPQRWSLDRPALYSAHLRLRACTRGDGDERRLRFGLRSLEARGATLRLNSRPIYPRLALSWGWYPDRRCPNPGPERVRSDLLRLRAMGYNGVKLCLWFPPPYYFELADELGLILWLELPMWLPNPSPLFYRQTPLEYERLARAAANHPSVLIYTLGCELNRSVEAPFLAELYGRVKALAGDALVRDNSGSGEAYGGWLDESADFYDHHFYCDLQYLRPLLDTFAPGWRAQKPWLMGEFCDYDTLRDLPALLGSAGGEAPWWMQPDPQINPQGARWEMRVTGHAEALRRNGLVGRSDELVHASWRQGLLHRKVTLETVRARPDLSGYVVTGEADTPVSTAGMWDDLGRAKFDAEAFRAFNDDLVLLLGWERRRAWVAGGDRPAFLDPYNRRAGEVVRAHLLVSNYSPSRGPAHLSWWVACPDQGPLAGGEATVRLSRGRVQEVAVAEFCAPEASRPGRVVLRVELRVGARSWTNAWPLWIYPADPWAASLEATRSLQATGVLPFGLVDPIGVMWELPDLARPRGSGDRCIPLDPDQGLSSWEQALVCTAWTPPIRDWVAAGGRAVLLQQRAGPPGPLPVIECPYWREAVKWAEPHPAWGDFPHETDPGLQFYALATDCALDASALAGVVTPLLRRLDSRSLELHEYAVLLPWGRGEVIVSTLRLQGGLGDQPGGLPPSASGGLARSPAAACLLASWLNYLQRPSSPDPHAR